MQQGEVGATPGDRFKKVETTLPGGVGCWRGGDGIDQAWPEGVESFADLCRQLLVLAALAEGFEPVEHRLWLAEAEIRERFLRVVRVDLLEPQSGERMGAGFRFGKHFVEVPGNALAVNVKRFEQCRPVAKIHGFGDQRTLLVVRRQHVRLRVIDVLQTVFEAAQEFVGTDQLFGGFRRD